MHQVYIGTKHLAYVTGPVMRSVNEDHRVSNINLMCLSVPTCIVLSNVPGMLADSCAAITITIKFIPLLIWSPSYQIMLNVYSITHNFLKLLLDIPVLKTNMDYPETCKDP